MATWTVQNEGNIAMLSLDDGKANALLVPEFRSFEAALDEAEKSGAKAVILTGRPGYFSAGLNLKALAVMPVEQKRELVSAMGDAVLKLFLYPLPVVAAVSGHALGGGAMFALAADIRVFAEGPFKFGLNEVPAGLFVPTFAIEIARAAVSQSRLTELVIHGRILSPSEASSMHVCETLHAPESLMAAAMMRAKDLAQLSGAGYAATKRLVRGPSAQIARASLPAELEQLATMLK